MSAGFEAELAFVGPYRLVNRIGEGGMGVVHLALDPTGRAVALKVLRPHVASDPQARRRLAREVDTLRRVQHPHVAPVLDADVGGDVPYVVTAFVPGRTLEEWIDKYGPLAPEHVAHVGRTLADALRAIHAVGVVHRDLKPTNVMLVDGQPVVIDFGIAHMVDESRITVAGLVMGTPGYLSPEVVEGQPVTAATDWWGWGATLAYAATGRPPFGDGRATVVLDRVRRGDCDLSGADPRVAQVLAAALVVDPRRRGNIDDLLQGLAGLGPWRPPGETGRPPGEASRSASGPEVVAPPEPRRIVEPPPVPSGAATQAAVETELYPVVAPRAGASASSVAPTVATSAAAPSEAPAARAPAEAAPATVRRKIAAPGGSGASVTSGAGGTAVVDAGGEPQDEAVRSPRVPILLGLAALAALAAVTPGLGFVLSVGWLFVARVTDASVTAMWRRRSAHGGERSGDLFAVLAAVPWRLVKAAPMVLGTLVVPVLMAASIAFFAALAEQPSTPSPDSAVPLAAGMIAGWLAAWWGPGGMTVRRGTQAVAVGCAARRRLYLAVLVVQAFVCVAAILVYSGGAEPDWEPLVSVADGLGSVV